VRWRWAEAWWAAGRTRAGRYLRAGDRDSTGTSYTRRRRTVAASPTAVAWGVTGVRGRRQRRGGAGRGLGGRRERPRLAHLGVDGGARRPAATRTRSQSGTRSPSTNAPTSTSPTLPGRPSSVRSVAMVCFIRRSAAARLATAGGTAAAGARRVDVLLSLQRKRLKVSDLCVVSVPATGRLVARQRGRRTASPQRGQARRVNGRGKGLPGSLRPAVTGPAPV